MVFEKGGDGWFVIGEVAKGFGIFEGELERFERVVEADDAKRAMGFAGGAENGEDIRGGAEADVPDHKFAGVRGHALDETQLFYVERLGFGGGTDDGVKGFAFGERVDAVDAVDEFDDAIAAGRHT